MWAILWPLLGKKWPCCVRLIALFRASLRPDNSSINHNHATGFPAWQSGHCEGAARAALVWETTTIGGHVFYVSHPICSGLRFQRGYSSFHCYFTFRSSGGAFLIAVSSAAILSAFDFTPDCDGGPCQCKQQWQWPDGAISPSVHCGTCRFQNRSQVAARRLRRARPVLGQAANLPLPPPPRRLALSVSRLPGHVPYRTDYGNGILHGLSLRYCRAFYRPSASILSFEPFKRPVRFYVRFRVQYSCVAALCRVVN